MCSGGRRMWRQWWRARFESGRKWFGCSRELRTKREQRRGRRGTGESARGEGEDEEIAFAGDDDGQGAAVGRDGEIAEAETVKDGNWRGLGDGDFVIRGDRR